MHYDFDAFLNQIKYLDKEDILETAYKKHKSLDKSSTMYSLEGRRNLQDSIQGLLYWLETGQRPPNITDRNFLLLKPLCENLIRKNQLGKEAIEVFEE